MGSVHRCREMSSFPVFLSGFRNTKDAHDFRTSIQKSIAVSEPSHYVIEGGNNEKGPVRIRLLTFSRESADTLITEWDGKFIQGALLNVRYWMSIRATLWVGDLPSFVTEESLQALFQNYGKVRQARILPDLITNRTLRIGLVQLERRTQMWYAYRKLLEEMVVFGQSVWPIRVRITDTDSEFPFFEIPVSIFDETRPPHFVQPNTLEFDFALAWRKLYLRQDAQSSYLIKEQIRQVHQLYEQQEVKNDVQLSMRRAAFIFVGNIPLNMTSPELVIRLLIKKICCATKDFSYNPVVEVAEVKVCQVSNNQSYKLLVSSEEDAALFIQHANGWTLGDAVVTVRPWIDHAVLCIMDLPRQTDNRMLKESMLQFGEGVGRAMIVEDITSSKRSKGIALVEFHTRHMAWSVHEQLNVHLFCLGGGGRPVRSKFLSQATDDQLSYAYVHRLDFDVTSASAPSDRVFRLLSPGDPDYEIAKQWRTLALSHENNRIAMNSLHRKEITDLIELHQQQYYTETTKMELMLMFDSIHKRETTLDPITEEKVERLLHAVMQGRKETAANLSIRESDRERTMVVEQLPLDVTADEVRRLFQEQNSASKIHNIVVIPRRHGTSKDACVTFNDPNYMRIAMRAIQGKHYCNRVLSCIYFKNKKWT
eukprot:TRINITY_DN8119_c0_g1::TRINITY_DN8119_c0_g1_i1::g.7114::m.7114 TRINITY_DN8119_c0_g1::TRINITY_DN8119_c0_g1_i1::g.7114  ORF type:complete len:651 (+),score=48.19,RRM_1/PF00076.17/2.7e-09,RRM_1/PF00076.17/95,RRM_1/PF00076.17/1.5e+03,RRM_1/PF00076.17/4.2e-05,RRM_1/PF00076.17/5.3e-05,RRM_6/PF14259.1/0.00068,RRM_6/PF14259.1/6e+02,RRM_6/PF14259.1/0.00038,RRM_6/PF14259.1/4e-05,RRM_5/PF13893.1/43,RRM_5/PF13893.1/54,RRM_5/PF13893.1/1.1e+03,RRM_5/PF13893.1/0.17,RRM_5/PF13893.1/2.8,NOPS/PF08075.6/0.11 TRINIT